MIVIHGSLFLNHMELMLSASNGYIILSKKKMVLFIVLRLVWLQKVSHKYKEWIRMNLQSYG